ncbi:MAG: alpha/beta fold hydrolase [Clostridia bacterium]|nr:alpha/beta fold hydrolase [Clostridia bacterium]
MKKKIVIALSVTVGVIAVLFLAMSAYIGTQVVAGSTQLVTNESTSGVSDTFWETYGMDCAAFCEKYEVNRVEITSSFDGHIIPADHILAEGAQENGKTVVMVHGLGGNRLTNYPVAEMFLEMGFNVLTYDQRSSNENTAEKTTFGYWEKYDLIDCIDYISELAPDKSIGVWGTSFGGATACQAAGYENTDEKIDFLVLDCPVSSMEWMVNEEMKGMDIGIPIEYMTLCGNIANRIMLGFDYNDADSAEAAKNVDGIAVLVINSKADELTPYFMGKDIYDSIKSQNKYIWTVEDSEHTEMWLDYNEQYREEVGKLVEAAGK